MSFRFESCSLILLPRRRRSLVHERHDDVEAGLHHLHRGLADRLHQLLADVLPGQAEHREDELDDLAAARTPAGCRRPAARRSASRSARPCRWVRKWPANSEARACRPAPGCRRSGIGFLRMLLSAAPVFLHVGQRAGATTSKMISSSCPAPCWPAHEMNRPTKSPKTARDLRERARQRG